MIVGREIYVSSRLMNLDCSEKEFFSVYDALGFYIYHCLRAHEHYILSPCNHKTPCNITASLRSFIYLCYYVSYRWNSKVLTSCKKGFLVACFSPWLA